MSNTNETIISFAKKGFLLDKESLDFFVKIDDVAVSEEVLNQILLITRSRIITKKILGENLPNIKAYFLNLEKEKQDLFNFFFIDYLNKHLQSTENASCTTIMPASSQTSCISGLKIISSNIIPYKRIEVKDFVTHFKNRYNFFKDILRERKELDNLISINKIGTNRNFSIIGIVFGKRITKNKNIIFEVEDLTGKVKVLASQDKDLLLKKAKEVVPDDVIGIKCSGSGDFIYANDIFFPDSYITEKRKSEEEGYALFISDMHVGSKLFLEEKFMRFLSWIRGEDVDDSTREKINKIKYIFAVGDNVDGVGIYPGQEPLLKIKDLKEQYKKLAEYLKMIPSHIKIILCPGQHDAVRVPEPQPAIDSEFAKDLSEMKNVYLVSNPAMVEIDCTEKKKGFKVLMYHGASIIRNWIDEVEELRLGHAHLNPSKVGKYMLRHRHLSPTHSSNVYVPNEKEDMLIIKETPDIVLTGDLHKADVDIYNNTLIIACSCWQSTTPFEEKVGNQPDPCKVPMLNLKTRELKILDFN